MKARLAVVLAVAVFSLTLAFWGVSSPAIACHPILVSGAGALLPMALGSEPTYVGVKKCKKCHSKVHRSWKKTKMANAFETLKPGASKEMKEKYGLDPAKDYTKDVTCLKCHTTGFGEEGGYAIPDESDKKSVKRAGLLAGVVCEACHSPGSEYIKQHKEIMKSKRKYKREEMIAGGLNVPDETTCKKCHNDKSPTFDKSKPFVFEEMKKTGTHDHEVPKQRE